MKNLSEFFTSSPPNETTTIERLCSTGHELDLPDSLTIYCTQCSGERLFSPVAGAYFSSPKYNFYQGYITFKCNNCKKQAKTYSIRASRKSESDVHGAACKFGEYPPYGPTITADLESLLGDSLQQFRNGLKCEADGLGIGAFSYYRRVIDSQRTTLFDQFIQVSKKLGAPKEIIDELEVAKADRQFSSSFKAIKGGALQALYIDGHNPLTLLYDAVSEGLHAQTDSENMQTAKTIRLLLAEIALRLKQLLEDHDEVRAAVSTLLKAKLARTQEKSVTKSQTQESAVASAQFGKDIDK